MRILYLCNLLSGNLSLSLFINGSCRLSRIVSPFFSLECYLSFNGGLLVRVAGSSVCWTLRRRKQLLALIAFSSNRFVQSLLLPIAINNGRHLSSPVKTRRLRYLLHRLPTHKYPISAYREPTPSLVCLSIHPLSPQSNNHQRS